MITILDVRAVFFRLEKKKKNAPALAKRREREPPSGYPPPLPLIHNSDEWGDKKWPGEARR